MGNVKEENNEYKEGEEKIEIEEREEMWWTLWLGPSSTFSSGGDAVLIPVTTQSPSSRADDKEDDEVADATEAVIFIQVAKRSNARNKIPSLSSVKNQGERVQGRNGHKWCLFFGWTTVIVHAINSDSVFDNTSAIVSNGCLWRVFLKLCFCYN